MYTHVDVVGIAEASAALYVQKIGIATWTC